MATYLYKKAALVQNRRIQIRPFISPQLYQRYVDLSRNLYVARKSDTTLKIQVRIGNQDLTLRIKINNPENPEENTEWEFIEDLTKFGPISCIDLSRSWTTVRVQPITSPPASRTRYLQQEAEKNAEKDAEQE